MIVVEGKCFASGGASFDLIKLKLYGSGMLYFTAQNGSLVSVKREQLSVSDKLGSIPREITLPNNDLLIIDSDPLVDEWLANGKKDFSRWERSSAAVIGSMVGVPLALYFVFAIAVPNLAVVFAPYVPDIVVEISSDHTMKTLDATLLKPSEADTEKVQALHQNWLELIASMDLERQSYTILFRNSKLMGPNAFALPNGTIVFTDQLLELVDYDEDILTAIFMHEIGHVEQHHSIRLVSQAIVSAIAINYFIGDVGAFFDIFASAGNTIASNQFTQKLEWEADNFALDQLLIMGKDPVDFARGMQKFSELSDHNPGELEQLFNSHPLTDERIFNALAFAGLPKDYREKLISPEQRLSEDTSPEAMLEVDAQ
jgi:Zn-dependent protease with chaperone function